MLRCVYADDVRLGERVHQRLATRAEVVGRLECWNEFGLRAADQVRRRLKNDLAIPSGVSRLGRQELCVDEVSGGTSFQLFGLPKLKGGEVSPGRDPAPSYACVFLTNHLLASRRASGCDRTDEPLMEREWRSAACERAPNGFHVVASRDARGALPPSRPKVVRRQIDDERPTTGRSQERSKQGNSIARQSGCPVSKMFPRLRRNHADSWGVQRSSRKHQ